MDRGTHRKVLILAFALSLVVGFFASFAKLQELNGAIEVSRGKPHHVEIAKVSPQGPR